MSAGRRIRADGTLSFSALQYQYFCVLVNSMRGWDRYYYMIILRAGMASSWPAETDGRPGPSFRVSYYHFIGGLLELQPPPGSRLPRLDQGQGWAKRPQTPMATEMKRTKPHVEKQEYHNCKTIPPDLSGKNRDPLAESQTTTQPANNPPTQSTAN